MVEGLLTRFATILWQCLCSFSVVMERPLLKVSGIVQEIVTHFLSSAVRTVRGVDTCLFTPPLHSLDSIPALSIPAPQQLRAGHALHASSGDHRDACVPDFHLSPGAQGPGHQGCKTDFSETLRHCEGEQTVTQL